MPNDHGSTVFFLLILLLLFFFMDAEAFSVPPCRLRLLVSYIPVECPFYHGIWMEIYLWVFCLK